MPEGRVWATRSAPVGGQLSLWRCAIREALCELEVKVTPVLPLDATLRLRPLGPVALTRMSVSNEQTLYRTRFGIGRCRRAQFELINVRHGCALLSHCSRRIELRVGDSVLIDNRQRYSFASSAALESLSFQIPVGWLQLRIPRPEDAVARCFSPNSRWGATLLAAIDAIACTDSSSASADGDRLSADQLAGALALVARHQN